MRGSKGVKINPGLAWSVNPDESTRMRLCFAPSSHEEINEGVAAVAEVCRREFGATTSTMNDELRAKRVLFRVHTCVSTGEIAMKQRSARVIELLVQFNGGRIKVRKLLVKEP